MDQFSINKILKPEGNQVYSLKHINDMLYENRDLEMSITVDKIFDISCHYEEELFLINNVATSREQLESVYNLTIPMVEKLFDRIVLDRFIMINKKEEYIFSGTDYHCVNQPIKDEYTKFIFVARSINEDRYPPMTKNYQFILVDGFIETNIYTNNIAFDEYMKSVKVKNTINRS
jgi:hypothetical protein